MMNTIRILLFTLLSGSLLMACSSGNKETSKETTTQHDSIPAKENFTGGTVLQLTCKADASQSYAIYLPKNYVATGKYPLLIAFDAHGDGKLPVDKYKELAEQYGYILAGSNNSKNGLNWQESASIAEKLLTDLRGRFAVNEQRLYLMGFSGGARVANGLTIVNGAITGVICCGAAAPAINSPTPRNNYTFIGIAGLRDFNYTEMRKYDMVDLAGYRLKHALITFDGKHEWPEAAVMDEAIWWMELNEMRKDKKYRNDALIQQKSEPWLKEIKENKKNGKQYANYLLCKKTINFYENLIDLKEVYDLWKELQQDAKVDKALKKEEGIWQDEEMQKAFYVKCLQEKDANWWKSEVNSLQQKIKKAGDPDEAHMYQRILDYLSLVCYMQTNGALQQGNVAAASYFDNLYMLVDPSNSEAHYFHAQLAAKNGNKEEAIQAIKKSIECGFKDRGRLEKEADFQSFQQDPSFQEAIKGL